MKRLLSRLCVFFGYYKSNKSVDAIVINTIDLRSEKKSDVSRWKDNNQLFNDWNERSALLGDFLRPNLRILEFGAGNMFLKTYLKNYKSYTPSDIIKRFDETIVCDLNRPLLIDLSIFDVAVFSGVLEYVYDIDSVFNQLNRNNVKQIVMSYCCSDVVEISRAKNGWLSDYTKSELELIFIKYNYRIKSYIEWRKQSIYNLVKI
jgi:hypothetical protein